MFSRLILPVAIIVVLPGINLAQDLKTVSNLNASKEMVYFNLATGKEIPTDKAASKEWDISFYKTTIGLNNNGAAITAQVVNAPFDKLQKAPSAGYKADAETGKAIPTGSGNGWYNYNMEDHTIVPVNDRTIVIKAQNNRFYKIQILSYNKDGKLFETTGFYTFRYSVIAGSK